MYLKELDAVRRGKQDFRVTDPVEAQQVGAALDFGPLGIPTMMAARCEDATGWDGMGWDASAAKTPSAHSEVSRPGAWFTKMTVLGVRCSASTRLSGASFIDMTAPRPNLPVAATCVIISSWNR